jgi:hypothetical protein
LKTIINLFTSNTDPSSKSEDILLRCLIFYCNLADTIIYELNESEDGNNNNYSWFNDPTPQRQGAVYFEFFDQVSISIKPLFSLTIISHFRINKN